MNTTACINLLLGKKKNKVLVGDKAVQDILRRRIAGYDLTPNHSVICLVLAVPGRCILYCWVSSTLHSEKSKHSGKGSPSRVLGV